MMGLAAYGHLGDPDVEVTLDRRARRRQEQAEAIREHARHAAAEAPPISAETAERIAGLLSAKTPPHQLMRWRLQLFCGHVVERRAHIEHRSVHAAFTAGLACKHCGLDPATIVAARPLGPGEPSPAQPGPARSDRVIRRRRGPSGTAGRGTGRRAAAASV